MGSVPNGPESVSVPPSFTYIRTASSGGGRMLTSIHFALLSLTINESGMPRGIPCFLPAQK